jgi:hypothetical protein
MLVDKNIIDALKNQGIEPDIPQLDFIHEAIKIQPTKKKFAFTSSYTKKGTLNKWHIFVG